MAGTATTTAVAYKTALMAALVLRAGLAGVQVGWTFPGETLRSQAVYFGKTHCQVSTPVMRGPARLRRQEDYLVELVIDVCDGSNDESKTETIAYGILGEVDDTLATNATMGVAIVSHIQDWEVHPYYDVMRNGWAAIIRVNIAVMARLN